jgi:Sulfatase
LRRLAQPASLPKSFRAPARLRELAFAGLHLAVLWSFAFAQPLLDLLGDTPEFFVARGNTPGDILLLAWTLVVVPPLVLTAAEALAELVSTGLRRSLHLCLVALLTAAFALQLVREAGVPAGLLVAGAAAFGVLAAIAYARTAWAPAVLTVLGPAPLVFLAVFLLLSPVSKLLTSGQEADAFGVSVPGEPPVTVVVFDELAGFALNGADGRIDASRYPNFARLARDSTWYRNATTVADFTERAVPALLTGKNPDKGALPIAADHPDSLFTLLGGRYSFDVTEPVTDVCPQSLCPDEASNREPAGKRRRELASDLSLVSLHLLLPDALATGLDPVDRSFGNFRTGGGSAGQAPVPASAVRAQGALAALSRRRDIVRDFERGLARAPQRRHLTFFHVELPHSPYEFLPSGQRYPQTLRAQPGLIAENQPVGGAWSRTPALARHGFERYLLQIGYADRVLGQILDHLQRRGLYERGLVVVVADHGASFLAGTPHRAARRANLATIAGIPLLIKSPGQHHGRVDESNVDITDVLPTMAARLDVRLPWRTDGRPASQAHRGGRIRLQPHYGETDLTLSFSEFVRQRDELVRRMNAFFPPGPGGLYRGGPAGDLIAAAADRLPAATGASFELDEGSLLADVRPDGSNLPALLSGSVSGLPRDAQLALALNGRVAATATHYQEGRVDRFAAIVPPDAFARGANRVDLVAAIGTGSSRRVLRVQSERADYRLVQRDGRESIVSGSGETIAVDTTVNAGFLDGIDMKGGVVMVSGWAGDTSRGRVADRVLAFVGERLLAAPRPSLDRPDVAQAKGEALRRAGFNLSAVVKPGTPAAAVRVFALLGRRAVPLPVAAGP